MPALSGTGPIPPKRKPFTVEFQATKPVGPIPPRRRDPNSKSPVDQISSDPASRSGLTSSNLGKPGVGTPTGQAASTARKASFTAANNGTAGTAASLTAADQARDLNAVEQRKSGVLGCIGKSPATAPGKTPGCNDPCDTVDCLTKMLTGNLLDLDAKKLMCDVVSSTERSLKRQIDSTGDQLLNAAQTLTSLAPVIAPLRTLQGFVNGIDPGQVANCFGAQALKDEVNGQFNKAANSIKKFQKGYQDKIAEKFNKATAAAQQFSITPNLCANGGGPVSLRAGLGKLFG